jgi:basic membrane protein A
MKKLITVILSLAMLISILSFVGCKNTGNNPGGNKDVTDPDKVSDTMTSTNGKYTVAMVTDVGQLKDKSFNQGTWDGVKLYAAQNNKSYKYYQPANGSEANDTDRYDAYIAAINGGAEIIVAPGFLQFTALTKAAKEHTDVKFVFIDGWDVDLDNVVAVSFHEEQCGYLAGYAAVVEGNTKLGFTGGGGGTNAAVNRYGYGFVQGADAAAKETKTKVTMNYSYLYGDNYSASQDLQTQINGWYSSGIQCVFACGGSMCNSVFAAAASNNAKSIGVDVDQSGESSTVITSAMKGLSEASKKMLGVYFDGKWSTVGNTCANLGVDDNAVGLPFSTSKFSKFTEKQYNDLVNSMKTGGSLKVDSKYDDFNAGKASFENVTVNFIK